MSDPNQTAVAVIGSLNLDYFTRVDELPAPGETVASDRLDLFRGGKGANQAIAVRRQGCKVGLFGATGDDDHGAAYRSALEEEGIDIANLVAAPARTGAAFITVDSRGENMIVIAPGANDALSADDIRRGAAAIEGSAALLGQFEIPVAALVEAVRIANQRDVPVVINPSPFDPTFPWQEVRTDYLIVNEGEAAEVLEFSPLVEDLATVRQRLHELRVEHLIITRGGDSTLVYGRSIDPFDVPTLPVLPIDTVGAGDAFAGCFTARIAAGEALEPALQAANCAGALATLGAGAQDPVPDRNQVDRHIAQMLDQA